MTLRALLAWFILLAVAVANGALREAILIPATGDVPGRAISTVMLSAAILLVAWLTVGWIGVRTAARGWAVGALWVGLTLAFEFLAGHYLLGKPWSVLLEDYDVMAGRIWPLVLVTTLVAPVLAGTARGVLRR
jgi:hypothetical protein